MQLVRKQAGMQANGPFFDQYYDLGSLIIHSGGFARSDINPIAVCSPKNPPPVNPNI